MPRVRKPKPKPVIRQKKPMAKLEYKKAYDQRQFAWTCPICKTEFNGTYGSVMGSRRFHWRTKHPDMPSTMIHKEAPTVVAVSFSLPEGEKAWICPLCPAALPSLPTVDRKRAVRDHISKKVTKVKHCNPSTIARGAKSRNLGFQQPKLPNSLPNV